MKTVQEIRNLFIDYFTTNDHQHVQSSNLIPDNDPTLMFTNAGMVQFKDVFTGLIKPPYTKAVTSQKCLRAGGKHNDLENVGYTARHHTFFEMLGNFSFGDYFKEEAIYHAWTLITKVYKLPKEKLWVTVYHDDVEAASLWKKIANFSDDRIIPISTNDNFWSMGETGPCGPCSEIFYDHGAHIPGGLPGTPDADGDRFIEIWNLVFMQFNQKNDGTRDKLPKPSIDTGMGLERISAILQGVHDNYDIDLFQKIISQSEKITNNSAPAARFSHRVIADHLRASSFLLSEGILPSNEGRGYVLRRIMRRAMRHAHLLGAHEALLWKLVPTLVDLMGATYPELERAQPLIIESLRMEEDKFRQTLSRGLKILEEEKKNLKSNQSLPGDVAFKLYDTYGFPLDLTQDILKADQIAVDIDGFNKAMETQQNLARSSWAGSGDTKQATIWYDLSQNTPATQFIGYDALETQSPILKIIKDDQIVSQAQLGEKIFIITQQTPFYPQGGGQVGDRGIITTPHGQMQVEDTQKYANGLIAHYGRVTQGVISIDETANLQVDKSLRKQTRANHTTTHIMHAVLRNLISDTIFQKGSYVGPDRLRFDFSFNRPLTDDEIFKIEQHVNKIIQDNLAVSVKNMSPQDAIDSGALALFGEKYGDSVRVVSVGDDQSKESIELCGGTHVSFTGDIGSFKILAETGVASGIRRIEAVTGQGALDVFYNTYRLSSELAKQFKTNQDAVLDRVLMLIQDNKKLEKEIKSLKQSAALYTQNAHDQNAQSSMGAIEETANSISILTRNLKDVPANELKALVDTLKQQIKSGVVLVTSTFDEKVNLVVGVTDDLTNKINAIDLAKQGSALLGGKGGGGRPDMAQAGGVLCDKIPQAIETLKNTIASIN